MARSLILVCVFTLFSDLAHAQDCYAPTICSDGGKTERAEIVPLSQLSKCEDYKAKAKAVPGLILAERKSLVAASECSGALARVEAALSAQFSRADDEEEKRRKAESRLFWWTTGGVIAGVIVGVATIFVFSAFRK